MKHIKYLPFYNICNWNCLLTFVIIKCAFMYCRNIFKFKFYYYNNKDPFNERKLPSLRFHFHNNLSISLINKCDWLYKVQKGEGGRAQKWHWNLSTQEWIQSVEYLNPSAIANHQRPFRPYFELNLHRIKNVGIH